MATGSKADGEIETNVIHTGDVLDVLPTLPESSVHMCMTSPPYFGLRDYGVEGQIGLEDSLDAYIEKLVRVGDEIRRVLRDDGSWWLNLGDTYGGDSIVRDDGQWTRPGDDGYEDAHTASTGTDERRSVSKLGRKNKMLVPHRVAIALQDAGWVVRNDATWYKPNPMPTPVDDRLNTTTEQVFFLTPKPDYWSDFDAIREPYETDLDTEPPIGGVKHQDNENRMYSGNTPERDDDGKIPGDVFEVTIKPFPEAHFAVYPEELCDKPIRATAPGEVCAECGSPSDCDCDTDETEPGIVLDPFAGAGTTLLKAKKLGRRFVGIELNDEYADLARKRLDMGAEDPSRFRDEEAVGLDEFV